jgi:hypothetical protein
MNIRLTTSRLLIGSTFGLVALATAAIAQTAPAPQGAPSPSAQPPAVSAVNSPEDCLKAAFDIAQSAEDKKLGDDQLAKIEDLLTKMESHCDAKQFNEAAAVGSDLKSLIQKQ